MGDLLGRFTNRADDHPSQFGRKIISASQAPQGAERDALESRRRELLASLRATPGEDLEDVLAAIMATGETFGASGEETDVKVKLYAEALRDMPTWAVERARIAFSRPGWKAPWNGRGIPSSADVVAECRAIVQPIEAELYRIGQILDAEIVENHTTPEQRADALARWERQKAALGRSSAMPGRTEDEIARERSEQQRANALIRDREERAKRRLQAEIDAVLQSGGEPFTGVERTA
ncbi:hypothetical protein LOK46_10675 [Methylobacterium sp. NMS14P]|uniref:hypothetical protein n=1 Tax=Methylobacterium sp. NMS14P TaxID=2894310 RepID=UPI00235914EB|nr:hypothetical protein [Methylobacterium sp. NMS14P]WCS27254.1 hypothetical protein LOK46_10675 [Methylobacterium sp. NMS14P]